MWWDKLQIWLSFLAKNGLFQLTLSQDWAQTQFLLTWLWLHSPLPWWMKSRTCTKSGFSRLGPRLLCLSDDGYSLTVLPQFFDSQAYCLDLNFWLLTPFCRTGTVRGTQPTLIWPSASRTQYSCGSPVSICGCWPPSTAFISTAMTADAFECPASAPPRWWDFTQTLASLFSIVQGFSHDWSQTQKEHFCQITDINKNILANVTVDPR